MSPIEEETRKSNLLTIILHGNHNLAKTNLSAAALEKAMVKEVKNIWDIPLTIDLVHDTNKAGVVALVVAD